CRRWPIAGRSWTACGAACPIGRCISRPASASRPSAGWPAISPRAMAAISWRQRAWMEARMDSAARGQSQSRLKLAVQKSGRLTDPSLDLLSRCGLKLSRGKDQLLGFGENMPLDVLFVRDDDIPDLVQEDVCDLGLVGLNVIEEKRLELAARGALARFEPLRALDFGHCRLALAVPAERDYQGPRSLEGKRIATTYPYLLKRFLEQR